MEVKLDKRYPLQGSCEQAWAVLSGIRAAASYMQGSAIAAAPQLIREFEALSLMWTVIKAWLAGHLGWKT
jgi:hypothetical protein